MSTRVSREVICNSCGKIEPDENSWSSWLTLTATNYARGGQHWTADFCPECSAEIETAAHRFTPGNERWDEADHGTQFEYEINDCRCEKCLQWYRDNRGEEVPEDMIDRLSAEGL